MTIVRIALANLRLPPTPQDSIALALGAIEEAAREGAAVVCFPECYIPGYRVLARGIQPAPSREFLERAWARLA